MYWINNTTFISKYPYLTANIYFAAKKKFCFCKNLARLQQKELAIRNNFVNMSEIGIFCNNFYGFDFFLNQAEALNAV